MFIIANCLACYRLSLAMKHSQLFTCIVVIDKHHFFAIVLLTKKFNVTRTAKMTFWRNSIISLEKDVDASVTILRHLLKQGAHRGNIQ
jgi:hypothetical protein